MLYTCSVTNLQRFQLHVSQPLVQIVYTTVESVLLYVTEDVTVTGVSISEATVSWRIPYFTTPEQYYVAYGTDPNNLNLTSAILNSPTDTSLMDQTYTTTLTGLNPGSAYYIQVVAVFDTDFVRYTESVFITKEPGKPF